MDKKFESFKKSLERVYERNCFYREKMKSVDITPDDINYSDIPEAVFESKREQIIDNAIKTLSKLGIDTSILNLNPANN